jgi:hypothetical protein
MPSALLGLLRCPRRTGGDGLDVLKALEGTGRLSEASVNEALGTMLSTLKDLTRARRTHVRA